MTRHDAAVSSMSTAAPKNSISMNIPYLSTRRALSRRRFLHGTGVALGLPFLDAMLPAFAAPSNAPAAPRRMLAVCNNLGLLPEKFFPAQDQAGRGYSASPYLEMLQ